MNIGIDLGGSHIGLGLVEEDKLIAKLDKLFSQEDHNNIENAIILGIDSLISQLLTENNISMDNIEKIGVASPGTISNGKITAWNLGVKDFDLKTKLEEKYQKTVKIRNDGKCAALTEKKYGSLKDVDDAIFINIGTGVGGAVFLGGKLLEPKKYSGFELGHMVIVKNGIECTCGKKGCFERYASMKVLKTKIIEKLNLQGQDISGKIIREQIMEEHHDEIKEIVEEWIDYLRVGIGSLIDIFEPEKICFGGSFSYYEGHPVLNKLVEELGRYDSTFNKEVPKICTADFKNDAGIIGSCIDN